MVGPGRPGSHKNSAFQGRRKASRNSWRVPMHGATCVNRPARARFLPRRRKRKLPPTLLRRDSSGHCLPASINRTHALLRLATTSALLAFHIAATLVQRGTSPSIAARHHRAHISARLLCWARNRQRERRRARPVRRWCRFVPVNDWRRDLRRSSVAGGRGAGSGGRLVAHVPVLPVAGTALTRHRVCSQPRYVCLYILASRRTKTKAFLHSCMLVITDTHIMFVIADTR
jgi:hypothetical protein